MLRKIENVNPDLIAITGDMVDGSVKHYQKNCNHLKIWLLGMAPFSLLVINEYYSGAESWFDETDRLGMTNLINEHRTITKNGKHIAIAGITDFRAHQIIKSHRSDPKKAIKSVDNTTTKIMLAHQPNSIYSVHDAGGSSIVWAYTWWTILAIYIPNKTCKRIPCWVLQP